MEEAFYNYEGLIFQCRICRKDGPFLTIAIPTCPEGHMELTVSESTVFPSFEEAKEAAFSYLFMAILNSKKKTAKLESKLDALASDRGL